MKKISFFILMLAFTALAACSAQQPEVTIPVTSPSATSTHVPTPTLNPQLLALQESVAVMSERFTLMSDGTLTDSQNEGQAVTGLSGTTGQWILQVGGEAVELDNNAVIFSDEEGISITGYTYDSATKVWTKVEAGETNASQLDIIFTSDPLIVKVGGVPLDVSTSVDGSARQYGLKELTITPETLGKLSARALHNLFVPGEEDTPANVDAFLKACADGQLFERTITGYTTDGGAVPKEMKLVVDCGQPIPEGSIAISGANFIFGEWNERTEGNNGGVYSTPKDMPWLNVLIKSGGGATGLLVDEENHQLVLFGGYTIDTVASIIKPQSGTMIEAILKSVEKYPTPLLASNLEPQYKKSKSWASQITVR